MDPTRQRLTQSATSAEQARDALRQGDLLSACDIIQAAVQGTNDPELAYIHVLARARMGDLDQAFALYAEAGLSASNDLDALALGARLLKDRALDGNTRRPEMLRDAAKAYQDVYDRFLDPFPGINAASLFLLAGDAERARDLAGRLLTGERLQQAKGYFDRATRSEALLILGDADAAAREIRIAAGEPDSDMTKRASTRKQLSLLAGDLPEATRALLLGPLAPPAVAMFCGHMFAAGQSGEALLAADIEALLDREDVAIAYGALARGSDIIFAERMLARGGELNVVLPFIIKDFIQESVGEDGPWRARFEACLEKASTVTFATDTAFIGDPNQFGFGAEVAMGLTQIRARHLGARSIQLAVWDGVEPTDPAGTAVDVTGWRRYGGRSAVLSPRDLRSKPSGGLPSGVTLDALRDRKAIIFADFPGFSKLSEAVLPAFWRQVMGGIASVLDRHASAIAFRNTWGDALYAVVDNAAVAAAITLELHEKLVDIDRAALGVDGTAGMRIGAHLGPVYVGEDFVTGTKAYFGTEVSRAARIEPITPPGAVYVTEPFAALLALEKPDGFNCTYVGRLQLAKGYGQQRMYRLSRTGVSHH